MDFHNHNLTIKEIVKNIKMNIQFLVRCYKGFYCPPNERSPKLCPSQTFSHDNNATSIKDCKPCPKDKNEYTFLKSQMETKTAFIFNRNCVVGSQVKGMNDKKLEHQCNHKKFQVWSTFRNHDPKSLVVYKFLAQDVIPPENNRSPATTSTKVSPLIMN